VRGTRCGDGRKSRHNVWPQHIRVKNLFVIHCIAHIHTRDFNAGAGSKKKQQTNKTRLLAYTAERTGQRKRVNKRNKEILWKIIVCTYTYVPSRSSDYTRCVCVCVCVLYSTPFDFGRHDNIIKYNIPYIYTMRWAPPSRYYYNVLTFEGLPIGFRGSFAKKKKCGNIHTVTAGGESQSVRYVYYNIYNII